MRQISEDTKRLLKNVADQPDETVPAARFLWLQSEFIRLKMKSEASAIRMSDNQKSLLDALKRCRRLVDPDAEFHNLRDLEFIDQTITAFDE